jgi:Rps23 Pro-64 3,4-dihydroxylase Tpa1-like proline 4-hydroxylase
MGDDLVLRVNPALKPEDYAVTFRRDGVVQIGVFLDPSVAEQLATTLKENTLWQVTYADETGGCKSLSGPEIAGFDAETAQRFLNGIVQRASTGFSYIYLACHLAGRYGSVAHADHPLHQLHAFLNSRAFLDFASEVAGAEGVDRVDAAATYYRPGDFLNWHTDIGGGRRKAAYTLGLTRGWRPDWGGHLLFHDEAGDISRGLLPAFNVLTLFKTPRPHSVSQVATYATQPRFVISGWLLEGAPQPT